MIITIFASSWINENTVPGFFSPNYVFIQNQYKSKVYVMHHMCATYTSPGSRKKSPHNWAIRFN